MHRINLTKKEAKYIKDTIPISKKYSRYGRITNGDLSSIRACCNEMRDTDSVYSNMRRMKVFKDLLAGLKKTNQLEVIKITENGYQISLHETSFHSPQST